MQKISYAGYRFPPGVIHQATLDQRIAALQARRRQAAGAVTTPLEEVRGRCEDKARLLRRVAGSEAERRCEARKMVIAIMKCRS